MKTLFLLPLLFISLCASTSDEIVLICSSPTAYAWHKSRCKGLDQCTHKILEVSKSEAINKHGKNKACSYCY